MMKFFPYLINKKLTKSLLCLALIVFSYSALANIEALQFDLPEQQQQYQRLIKELRCLVCQNQNLADSNAQLAQDLRQKTYEMVKQGLPDKEILSYMQERYGDFVLYRPPFNLTNALLWIGPFLILLITLLLLFRHLRRNQTITHDTEDQKKARELLDID